MVIVETKVVPLCLYPVPQVIHGCLGEESLESVLEFVKFVITVHSDAQAI